MFQEETDISRYRKIRAAVIFAGYLVASFAVLAIFATDLPNKISGRFASSADTGDKVCTSVGTKLGVTPRSQFTLGWPTNSLGKYNRASIACGITSVWMALEYYNKYNFSIEDKFLDKEYVLNNYLDTDPTPGAKPAPYFQEATANFGNAKIVTGKPLSNDNWQVVRENIDSRDPVVVFTSLGSSGTHIVLVTGYTQNMATGKVDQIYFNDPAKGITRVMDAAQFKKKLKYDNAVYEYIYSNM